MITIFRINEKPILGPLLTIFSQPRFSLKNPGLSRETAYWPQQHAECQKNGMGQFQENFQIEAKTDGQIIKLKLIWFPSLHKIMSSSLTPSDLLKATKFLVKFSQFEFLVMAEKKLFINLNFCH